MKVMILSALALCLAAPAVASADETFVIQTHRHHRHHWSDNNNNDGMAIYRDGQRLHHRHHGEQAFYDNGQRAWQRRHHGGRDAVVITGSADRPMHRHRHVIIQQDDNNNDY